MKGITVSFTLRSLPRVNGEIQINCFEAEIRNKPLMSVRNGYRYIFTHSKRVQQEDASGNAETLLKRCQQLE